MNYLFMIGAYSLGASIAFIINDKGITYSNFLLMITSSAFIWYDWKVKFK